MDLTTIRRLYAVMLVRKAYIFVMMEEKLHLRKIQPVFD